MCVLHIFVWPKHQSRRSSEIIKENVIKMNKQKLWRSLKKMMFGYDVSWSEDPDFSTYGIIRAENRKGMQEALSGLVFQPGRTYTFGSSAQATGLDFNGFYMISPDFTRFHLSVAFLVCSGRFFSEDVFDVVWGFWCIAQFVDAIGWRVPARGVIPEVKLNEIGTHPLRALSGFGETILLQREWKWWWGVTSIVILPLWFDGYVWKVTVRP